MFQPRGFQIPKPRQFFVLFPTSIINRTIRLPTRLHSLHINPLSQAQEFKTEANWFNSSSYSPRPNTLCLGLKRLVRINQSVSVLSSSRERKHQLLRPIRSSDRMRVKTAREFRDAIVSPSKASGGIPNPTETYLTACNIVPKLLSQPQHLLVVIDLNGTLLFRPSRKQPTKFVPRPFALEFLKYCIDTFTVVIWSSARPENVRNMCDAILTSDLKKKVAAIWGRDTFGLSRQDYELRVQCYKRLTKIWSDPSISRSHPAYDLGNRWDQTNTVLVDDSIEKGRSEPYNLIQIPTFVGEELENEAILPQVHDYLNHLSMHSNVSACLRAHPFTAQLALDNSQD